MASLHQLLSLYMEGGLQLTCSLVLSKVSAGRPSGCSSHIHFLVLSLGLPNPICWLHDVSEALEPQDGRDRRHERGTACGPTWKRMAYPASDQGIIYFY